MKYVWNYVVMSWLLIKLIVLSFTPAQLEYTVVVDANNDPSSLNCSEDTFITIMDVSIKNEGYCENESCIIDESDHVVLGRICENSSNCLIYGSNFSSACLLERRRFHLSYMCEAPISLDCSFESNFLCNWEQGTDDDFDWTRHSKKTESEKTGPDLDHTTNSIYGFYMYIEATDQDRNDIAQLISKPIVCKHVQCLTFWYHMYGNQIGSLNVYKKHRTQMEMVWDRDGTQNNQWIHATINLYCYEEFQIVIEGKIRNSNNHWQGDIALDDIYLFEGFCENSTKNICTFENKQSCGFKNVINEPDYIFWHIVQAEQVQDGPAKDHTIGSGKGFFLHLKYLEGYDKGQLESSMFNITEPQCLSFWYYIIGDTENTLTLYQLNNGLKKEIVSVLGDHEEKWKKKTVSVDIVLNDQIIIEGSIKQIGSISLDDISLTEIPCREDKEYSGSCLNINQQYAIEECATYHFQKESLNITLYPSLVNSNNEEKCTYLENEVGGKLDTFCRDNYLYNTCEFNLESFYWDYSDCLTFNKKILITYMCIDSGKGVSLPTAMQNSNDSATGLVVGLVIGGLLLAAVVILIVVLIRRYIFSSGPRQNIRNVFQSKDYVGSQDIALSHTATDSSHMQFVDVYGKDRKTGDCENSTISNAQNNNDQYTNVVAANISVYDTPANAAHRVSTFTSNDDEYAFVNPTTETSLNATVCDRTGTAASYMVFDQNDTGLTRTTFPSNGYQFAKPVKDDHKKIDDDDQYALSEEAVYDHSGSNRHKEFKDNIYNHAVDTVYDSGSHKRQNEEVEDTYDHFTGHKTEDDYDISTTN